jgi:RimK family alpha-L-glutamate ligase
VKIGVITRNPQSFATNALIKSFQLLNHNVLTFNFNEITAYIGDSLKLIVHGIDILKELSAVVVRPLGRAGLDQALFRIDLLYAMQENGVRVFNRPDAIEKCTDKFRSLYTLRMNGIPVPTTITTERSSLAMRSLDLLNSDAVVIKPMFGSRGHGSAMVRKRERDVIWELVRSLTFYRHVAYLQEFISHGGVDIRAFVLGDRVLAAMYRRAPPNTWKTNIAQGASPIRIDRLDPEIEDIAIRAAKALHCDIAGVDIAVAGGKPYVFEVNSQPDWRGLQSVFPDKNIALEIAKYIIDAIKR